MAIIYYYFFVAAMVCAMKSVTTPLEFEFSILNGKQLVDPASRVPLSRLSG